VQRVMRYLMLLRHIPRQPQKIDVSSLCDKLVTHGIDVSVRTVQRNLVELSEVFPLVADERSRPYGWSIVQDAPLLPLLSIPSDGKSNFAVQTVKLKCQPCLRHFLKSQPLLPNQKIEENGESILLTAQLPLSKELISWVLSCGPYAEVLEPKQLRVEIAKQLRKMVEIYPHS